MQRLDTTVASARRDRFAPAARSSPGRLPALLAAAVVGAGSLGATDAVTMAATIRVAAPTMHSIGFEWDLAGDANHDATCAVSYRVAGTTTWRGALGLLRIDYRGFYNQSLAYQAFDMLAGSILFLDPATTYEVRLAVHDPDGGDATKTLTITTLGVPLAGTGRSLHVVPGAGGGTGTAADPFRGMAVAQAAAAAGDRLLLHAGTYPAFTLTRAGAAGRPIAWMAAGDGDAVIDGELGVGADYLRIEGLVFRPTSGVHDGGVRGTVAYGTGPHDVAVVRNRFVDCRYSLSNPDQDWNGGAAQLYRRWYIADNVCDGGPHTEYFVRLYAMAESDICYNRATTTLNGLGGDGVSVRHSTNLDIYGNDIREVDDDAFEPDSSYANIRIWQNRAVSPRFQGVSFQPMNCSPWYIVRNEFVLAPPDRQATVFKANVFDRFVCVNNTFVVRGRYAQAHADIIHRAFSRNNLWLLLYDNPDEATNPGGALWYGYDTGTAGAPDMMGGQAPDWRTDVDRDGFGWESMTSAPTPDGFWWPGGRFDDVASFAAASHLETHGRGVSRTATFADPDVLGYASRAYPTQRLSLRAGSDAIDAGVVVPNLSDSFVGAAPDLGAVEFGAPSIVYGPRTTTTDTTPPVITAIAASTTSSSLTVSWTTNESADAQLEFGPTTAYGSTSIVDATLATAHTRVAGGLTAATTYHYRVRSRDAAGNLAVSSDRTATTSAGPTTGGTTTGGSTTGGSTTGVASGNGGGGHHGCGDGAGGAALAIGSALAFTRRRRP